MTSRQALSILNHWLHDKPDKQVIPEVTTDLSTNPFPENQGCLGYQAGIGTILHQQQKLLDQLYEQLNLPEELQLLFNQTLDHLVGWLHLLPAHPQHHCEPAGAVRHALETAFWAVAATEQIHFDHSLYPDQRRARQPLWRLMAGVAGLLYDSGRIVTCIEVSHPKAGHWPALQHGLNTWLQHYRIEQYQPQWQHCDHRPDKMLSSEYTWTTLLLLDQLTTDDLRYALRPHQDKGALWQTFISGLTGQHSPQAITQMVSAIEVARLKSVKLHFIRGEALSCINKPHAPNHEKAHPEQPVQSEFNHLQQVVSQLNPQHIKWAKGSLILRWPDDLRLDTNNNTPTPEQLLEQWSQQRWVRCIGNEKIIHRNGQQCVTLQPDISEQCRQWLQSSQESTPVSAPEAKAETAK